MKIEFLSCVDDGEGHFVVQRRITDDQGVIHDGIHAFPYDTLEWRAAEYGIDPSDVDTLLDIVLSEPYLTHEDYKDQVHLYDGECSVDSARAAHVSRCAKVKLANRISTRGKAADPLQLVRDRHVMDPEALDIKRALVAQGRDQQSRVRNAENSPPGRVAGLRAALDQTRRDSR